MNTPTQMNRSSASSAGIVPSATQSCTAIATACCAGPNICTACFAPLMVTLLNITVFGLHARFGEITVNSDVKPYLLSVSALEMAVSPALLRGPMSRSMCATSLPSPTSDSPTQTLLIFAISQSSLNVNGSETKPHFSTPARPISHGADEATSLPPPGAILVCSIQP